MIDDTDISMANRNRLFRESEAGLESRYASLCDRMRLNGLRFSILQLPEKPPDHRRELWAAWRTAANRINDQMEAMLGQAAPAATSALNYRGAA